MAYKIVMKDALKRAKEAFDNKKLGSQNSNVDSCVYSYGRGAHCVIGAMLPKEVIKEIKQKNLNESTSVGQLVTEGIIKCSDNQLRTLEALQEDHDAITGYTNKNLRAELNKTLGKRINQLCSKYKVA